MSDHENTDAWSSDGDSVSSESMSSNESNFSIPNDSKKIRPLK